MNFNRPPRRVAVILLLTLAALSIAAVGCRKLAKPQGWSSPLEASNVLFAAHHDDLYALDPGTLAPQWVFPADKEIKPEALYGDLATVNDTVFVPTYDGALYALDVKTGTPKWPQPFEADGPLVGGVAVSEEMVYFGSADSNVYAVDVATGAERWLFSTDNEVWSTPVVDGSTLYVTSLDGRLYALDAERGTELWSYKTAAGVASAPVVDKAAGLVYVGGFDSRLRAIDMETHKQKWEGAADNWFWTKPLVVGGVVYAGSLDGKVYAFNVATGEPHWTRPFDTDGPIRPSLLAVGTAIIAINNDGKVFSLEQADGSRAVTTDFELGGDVLADPILQAGAGGSPSVVVAVTKDGDVIRFDPAALKIVDQRKLGG